MLTEHKSYGDRFNRLKAAIQLGLPFGDTLPTIDADHEGPSLFFLTTDELVYKSNGIVWVPLASGSSIVVGSYIITGTGVWSGVGLVMDISDATYKINGTNYAGTGGTATHDPADATFPRIDTIYWDDAGAYGILTGVPAVAAVKPMVDPATQVELRTVLIPAGATTPGGITDETFFNEGTEATNASNIASIDFAYATSPLSGVVSMYAPAFNSGEYFSFRKASVYNATDYGFVVFNIRLIAAWASTKFLSLYFYNDTTPTTNALNILSGQYGFNRTVTGTWQTVTVPVSAMALITDAFDKLYFRTNGAIATAFQIDNVRIQTGSYSSGTGVNSFAGRTGMVDPMVGDYFVKSANLAAFPGAGSTAKIYVALDTGILYQWDGSAYTVISSGSASLYLGLYASLVALQTAHPTAAAGQYAQVDAGIGTDTSIYLWDADDADWIEVGSGGVATWGAIAGTLSAQTDLQTALDGKVDENAAITGATKTKVTYDAKGLVTGGADATTADIADSTNKRYVVDADLVKLTNTSGTNTGDEVFEYANIGAFPGTGAAGAVYVSMATNFLYRWDAGTVAYVQVGGSSGGGSWGSITGTLSAQTDLQTALDDKAENFLASFTPAAGIIANGDSLQESIEKLDGNIGALGTQVGAVQVGNNLFNYYNFR